MLRDIMVSAIIQARMTSSRLPGKVMLEIRGKPVLTYLIERVRAIPHIDQVVIATTDNATDDVLENFCKREGILCYRGSENDVLCRYFEAARLFGARHIARITSDCPLIDPQICGNAIGLYFREKLDYLCLSQAFAEGLDFEIFSFDALEIAHERATRKYEREHVTRYFHNHPESFRLGKMENNCDDSRYRITIDEPEDFDVVKTLVEALHEEGAEPFPFSAVKQYLDEHQDIFQKNAHIIRNEGLLISLKKETLPE